MALVVERLTKTYPSAGTPAVSEVSFTAPTGHITTLLGPSGSGKSTVLRIIAGLEQPDEGKVVFDGADTTRTPVQKRGVGFVFQSYALFTHMTVRKNIAFGLKVRKLDARAIDVKVDELLALVQLEGFGDRYPAQLSGGQRQRVAFARALAIEPRVLLLDEPFGALDARVRLELRDWLRRLHEKRNVTTVLVTHDQDEAMDLSQHVIVMHEGRIQQAGSPKEIYDKPATPFVASFVGGANVLRGRVQDGRAALSAGHVAAPEGARDGAQVHAFVRPHDVRVAKAPEDGAAEGPLVSMAKVERLAWLGATVKLELRLGDGEPMTVQMPKTEVDALGIAEGDRVMVDLREAKVFVEDYSI
jgi:sulfate transport system ATP-binding protein